MIPSWPIVSYQLDDNGIPWHTVDSGHICCKYEFLHNHKTASLEERREFGLTPRYGKPHIYRDTVHFWDCHPSENDRFRRIGNGPTIFAAYKRYLESHR